MEWLPARKLRPSLDVEPLEDRRLLSSFATAPSGEAFARPVDTFAETAPNPGGSTSLMDFGPGGFGQDRGQFGWSSPPSSGLQGGEGQWISVGGGWMTTPDRSPSAANPSTGVSAESTGAPAAPGQNSPTSHPSDGSGSQGLPSDSAASPAPGVAISLPIVAVPRAVSSSSVVRSASVPGQETRLEAGSTTQAPVAATSSETLLAVTSASPAGPGSASSPDQARGLVAILAPGGGPGGLVGQGGPTSSPAPSKGIANPAAPAEDRAGAVPSGVIRPGEPLEVAMPEPTQAGLIQDFMPFDRASVDAAIDRILEPFDGLASAIPELRGPMGLITASLAAAATVVAFEVVLRLRRDRRREIGGDEVEGLARSSGL